MMGVSDFVEHRHPTRQQKKSANFAKTAVVVPQDEKSNILEVISFLAETIAVW